MLATLVVISSFVPLVLSHRLSLFQRLLTPTVAGTVIMLIPITIMPPIFNLLSAPGAPAFAAPLSALATIIIISGIALKATGVLRLWAPVIGVAAGSIIGGFFGLYEVDRIARASWVGLPPNEWPGFDLDFGPTFWALLPAFLLVAIISTIRTISSSVAIQRISWRQSRAVDFQAVGGAITVDGISNFISGLAGTIPNTANTLGVSMAELTGVGARNVGIATGAVFIAMAFLPKVLALILAIPGPVIAAYFAIMLATLFVVGIKIVFQDGIDYRNGMIVGIAFLVGVGFQSGLIFPEYISEFAGGFLRNGMNAGGFTAILMTLFVELTEPRRSRIEMTFDFSALPKIRDFLGAFASRNSWDAAMANRLDAAAEETLLTLIPQDEIEEEHDPRHLRLTAYREEGDAVLEVVVSSGEENIQDRIALLGEQTNEAPIEREVSLRLLRHLASSVRHQQYHETDIVTVRVKAHHHAPP
jgi:NCS2 family nucleobase:cation symporter-2/xanthine permease XanP